MKTTDVAALSAHNDLPCAVSTDGQADQSGQSPRVKHDIVLVSQQAELGRRLVVDTHCCRAFWDGQDVGLTLGQYKIVHLLASRPGIYVTYRAIYDQVRGKGFAAGDGANGYRTAVRSALKNIRKKFGACDLGFDQIENYSGFGYCWKQTE
jgi:DNA-binding response OmpR family regulator